MQCNYCKSELTGEEVSQGICRICKKVPLWNWNYSAGGLIVEKSRCCKAPIKRTEGIITEICSACGKGNPLPIKYAV